MESLDVARVRRRFPALSRPGDEPPPVYFDGPAGSQVPGSVIDAMSAYLRDHNANSGGAFPTSRATDALLRQAQQAAADFLCTDEPESVVFGANMTTLTLGLSRALARTWEAGDEILLSHMEHDANVTPWVRAAADAGVQVRFVDYDPDLYTLDLKHLEAQLSSRTRLVAVGAANNATGTRNPVHAVADRAHDVGAELFVDAVHLAPHGPIDVTAWDCDYVACSAYKFFGPHVGVLWGRRQRLQELPAYQVRPGDTGVADRWMTGTPNFEGIAGTLAAIDYLADLGREVRPACPIRGEALAAAYGAIRQHEEELLLRLLKGLEGLPAIRVWGITDPARVRDRVPTVSFTHQKHAPLAVATALAEAGIFVWHGNFFALPVTEALGLEPDGMVRVGLLHYSTQGEVDRLLEALEEL